MQLPTTYYYLSYIENTEDFESQYPDGYPFVVWCKATPKVQTGTWLDEESGELKPCYSRPENDRSSLAIIISRIPMVALSGQTLYPVTDCVAVKTAYPHIDFSTMRPVFCDGLTIK